MTDHRGTLWVGDDGDLRLRPPTGHTYIEVKDALGASFDDDVQAWKFPAIRSNVLQVREAFGDAVDLSEQVKQMGDGDGFPPPPTVSHLPDTFYPYQKRAVEYLVGNPHGCLLNISPGLGKTAVAAVAAAQTYTRVLIVAPASLLFTWEREIHKWVPGQEVTIAHGHPPTDTGWVVTTYEGVVRHPALYSNQYWDVLIIDESVLVKNRTTQRYKALDKLRQKAFKVWMLSGSPTTRFADDLWTQMHLAYPKAFRSYWRFAERFCVFEDNIWAKTGKSIVGTRESRDITWELGDLMLTINQEDVLDLPDYLFETIDVPLSSAQKSAYKTMLHEFLIDLGGKELTADNKVAQLVRLQQIVSGMANFVLPIGDGDLTRPNPEGVASSKVDALIDLLEAQAYELPMLVWTHWKGNAAYLHNRLRAQRFNAEWVSGDDATKTRDAKIQAYVNGSTDILVLSLGIGKFGHTLTNSRTVVYLDKTWAADDYIQSLRRVRRIGLGHAPVLVTLHAPKTTDELLEANLAGKMPSIAKITNSRLAELLKGLGL